MKYAHFTGMSWPLPGKELGDLEWTLRYGPDGAILESRRSAASVVSAYWVLINMSERERRKIIAGIRAEMKKAKGA